MEKVSEIKNFWLLLAKIKDITYFLLLNTEFCHILSYMPTEFILGKGGKNEERLSVIRR